MPPKRSSPGAADEDGPSKKVASDAAKASQAKSKRWAAVSGSRNADDGYKQAIKDPAVAYAYICLCSPPWGDDDDEDDDEDEEEEEGDDEDEEEDDEDDEDGSAKPRVKCNGGKSCLCSKPAAENPDHALILSLAGSRKHLTLHDLANLRCPDLFDMYTFNDHHGYGVLEVVQNLFLDFFEAESDWREQWAVCEAMVFFLLTRAADPMMMIEGDTVDGTVRLVGRTFLSMLARLERQKMLKEDSEVKNLGLIMALYIKLASDVREFSVLEDEDEETLRGRKSTKGGRAAFRFVPDRFNDYIVAYANKYAIALKGLDDIDELAADCDGTVGLPIAAEGVDPWDLAGALQKYKRNYGGTPRSGSGIGGDSLDITAWSSAERKSHSFNGKDPLGKKEIDALKQGMVLQIR